MEVGTTHRDSPVSSGVAVIAISDAVLRAITAVAENIDDPFRTICIETLTEIRESLLNAFCMASN